MPFRKPKKYQELESGKFDSLMHKKLKDFNLNMPHPHFMFFGQDGQTSKAKKNLKENFTRKNQIDYTYSAHMRVMQNDDELTNQAREKLQKNEIYPDQDYANDDASLKMHISLNNMGSLDEKVITELLTFLRNEAVDLNNQLSFKFKIVRPEIFKDPQNAKRFSMNDQLTIYFDKYSSTGSMVNLASKIDTFLKSHKVPENQQKTGPKDKISLNSFVSLRFDNNKLGRVYGEYPFFDLEIQKFLKRHNASELADFPLFAIEKIFNDIILSRSIENLRAGPNGEQGLSDEDSKKVQQKFEEALKSPSQILKKEATGPSAPVGKPAQDVRKEPLLAILPTKVATVPDTKLTDVIKHLTNGIQGIHNTDVINSVIDALKTLDKENMSSDDKDKRAEQILKQGLNKALLTGGGLSSVELIEKVLKTVYPPNVLSTRQKP